MMPIKNSIIDKIKKEYEYKIDPLNSIDTAFFIYSMLYGHFAIKLEDYRFEEKIKNLKNILHNKGNSIGKNKLEIFEKTLNDISTNCKNIKKKVESDSSEIAPIIGGISLDYERNKDKPGVEDTYLKIGKELIDKEVNTFIEYEKQLLLYNETIIKCFF